jgi:hypothetical protein
LAGGEFERRQSAQPHSDLLRTRLLCEQAPHEALLKNRDETACFTQTTMLAQLLRNSARSFAGVAPRSFAGVSHPFLSLSFSTDVRQAHDAYTPPPC